MKQITLIFLALSGILLLGEAEGQSGGDRRPYTPPRTATTEKKAPIRFSKLFESRQAAAITPEVKEKAAEVVATAAANPETMEAIEAAAQALLGASASATPVKNSGSTVDPAELLSQGAKLIESSLPAAKSGQVDLDGIMPAVASAAPAIKEVAAPILKEAAAQTGSAKKKPSSDAARPDPAPRAPGVRLLPGGMEIPAPVDPLPNRISRPDVDASTKPTRITAGFAAFDANTNVVTFQENVELDHVEFRLTCDILVAELNNPEKAKAEGDPKGGQEAPQAAAARVASGGIRIATATGYVVIEKLTPEGSQVAKSRKTVYDARTQIVTLSEYPVLDDGKNLVRGKEAWTKILLSPDGKYQVDGPATYELVTSDNQIKPGRPH